MKHTQITTGRRLISVLTALLLILAMAAAALPQEAWADTSTFDANDFTFAITDESAKTVTLTKYNGSSNSVVIPGTVEYSNKNYTVTSIGGSAFQNCQSLQSVIIPGSVTAIGESAFQKCQSLQSVIIPGSVTAIGNYAFEYCRSLTSATISEGVTSIGAFAFRNSALTSVTIPASVTSIHSTLAFGECRSLTSITVDTRNNNYKDIGGVLCTKDGTTLVAYPIGREETSYTIPAGVKVIEGTAFQNCKLQSVTIPDGVRSIYGAFIGSTNLQSVTIPASVTFLDNGAFFRCSSLQSITADPESHYYKTDNGVLFDTGKTKLIIYPAGKQETSYTIPASVTSIDDYAFQYCSNLRSVTIPNGITSIDSDAFYYCSSLQSVLVMFGEDPEKKTVNENITKAISGQDISWYRGWRSFTGSTADTIDITIEPGSSYNIFDELGIKDTIYKGKTESEPYAETGITIPVFTLSGNTSAGTKLSDDGKTLTLGENETGTLLLKTYGKTIRVNFHSLSVDNLAFPELEAGKTPSALPLLISCSGNADVPISKVELSSTDFLLDDFKADDYVNAGGTNTSYLITPKSGLTPGVYVAKATVTYGYGWTAEARITLVVKAKQETPAVSYWCTLTADDLSFPDLQAGDAPQSQPLQLHCSGNTGTTITKVELSSADFLLDDSRAESYVGAGKTNSTYQIMPKAGLAPGSYKAKVTVTYSYGKTTEADITLTVTEAVQEAPASLTAKSKNYNTIVLSWKKADRAEKYQVYRSTKKSGTYKRISTTSKTALNNIRLTTGKTYYYKVRAYRTVDGKKIYSPFTAIASAAPRPSAPAFSLKAGKGKITASWKGVSGATGYRIYRASAKNGKFTVIKDSRGKARSYTSSKLRSRKTYYYKMRTYRVVDGKKIYSNYTKVKTIRTK